MKHTIGIIITLLLCTLGTIRAQDKIHKRQSTGTVNGTVLKLTDDKIYYIEEGEMTDSVRVLRASDIHKITFSNGQEMTFGHVEKNEKADKGNYVLMTEPLRPLFGSVLFTYEWYPFQGQAIESSLEIMGWDGPIGEYHGFVASIGYKWVFTPRKWKASSSNYRARNGYYLNPELTYSAYHWVGHERSYYFYDSMGESGRYKPTKSFNSIGYNFSLGRQWVFENRFIVDFYIGIGFRGISLNGEKEFDFSTLLPPFGFFASERDNLVFLSGLKLGYIF